MDYTLMHKNVEVAEIEIDDDTGVVAKIGDVDAIEHIPVGVAIKDDGIPDRKLLNRWWLGRSIPANRQWIDEALDTLGVTSTKLLIDKCLGLSLSDQYWVCPKDLNLKWSDVNFFENAFSEDVGNILFGETVEGDISLMSPDNTSDGQLRKKWIIADNKRYLIKGSNGTEQQEPLNEALATEVMRRLDIPHIPYTIKVEHNNLYSVCENFLTPQTELVSAGCVMQSQDLSKHVSKYQHFLKRCDVFGISDAEYAMAQMIAIDFLIVNKDRHFNNFGAVRNAETLEWLGIAPIYDSGTSMWSDSPTVLIGERYTEKSKTFRSKHSDQIKLASSLDFVDFVKLSDIADVADEIYKQSLFISDDRRGRLCHALLDRVQLLEKERDSRVPVKPRHQQQKNVVDDVANLRIEENHKQ
ncbi:hypothetical protein FACS1894204_08990 [Synergistales bacterium]|nr:hypothetical protein FACS1894204_08990 [Synergistales bacterium]